MSFDPKVSELLQLIAEALHVAERGGDPSIYMHAIKQWFEDNAPDYLTSVTRAIDYDYYIKKWLQDTHPEWMK